MLHQGVAVHLAVRRLPDLLHILVHVLAGGGLRLVADLELEALELVRDLAKALPVGLVRQCLLQVADLTCELGDVLPERPLLDGTFQAHQSRLRLIHVLQVRLLAQGALVGLQGAGRLEQLRVVDLQRKLLGHTLVIAAALVHGALVGLQQEHMLQVGDSRLQLGEGLIPDFPTVHALALFCHCRHLQQRLLFRLRGERLLRTLHGLARLGEHLPRPLHRLWKVMSVHPHDDLRGLLQQLLVLAHCGGHFLQRRVRSVDVRQVGLRSSEVVEAVEHATQIRHHGVVRLRGQHLVDVVHTRAHVGEGPVVDLVLHLLLQLEHPGVKEPHAMRLRLLLYRHLQLADGGLGETQPFGVVCLLHHLSHQRPHDRAQNLLVESEVAVQKLAGGIRAAWSAKRGGGARMPWHGLAVKPW
mmetsp:Transcript_38131/g.105006  ORF Transcript_38131/g.105006 Transcript_38131/m.105006 type:complete len:413 (-) Transcript_38131:66-1304(-)